MLGTRNSGWKTTSGMLLLPSLPSRSTAWAVIRQLVIASPVGMVTRKRPSASVTASGFQYSVCGKCSRMIGSASSGTGAGRGNCLTLISGAGVAAAVTGVGVGSGVDSGAGNGAFAGTAGVGSGVAGATGSAVGTGDGVTGSGVGVTVGLSPVGVALAADAAETVSSFSSMAGVASLTVRALRASSSPNTVGVNVTVVVGVSL